MHIGCHSCLSMYNNCLCIWPCRWLALCWYFCTIVIWLEVLVFVMLIICFKRCVSVFRIHFDGVAFYPIQPKLHFNGSLFVNCLQAIHIYFSALFVLIFKTKFQLDFFSACRKWLSITYFASAKESFKTWSKFLSFSWTLKVLMTFKEPISLGKKFAASTDIIREHPKSHRNILIDFSNEFKFSFTFDAGTMSRRQMICSFSVFIEGELLQCQLLFKGIQ